MLDPPIATKSMNKQITSHIMMVRPCGFRLNEQTAVNNYYQQVLKGLSTEEANKRAQNEFDDFVRKLREADINVYVFQDDAFPDTPDSIFPNNWVSFHSDGRVATYPMYAENRRAERREEMFDILADDFGFEIKEIEDFTHFEEISLFLEGTGSMILDRENRIAYAALSERTDPHVLETFCDRFDFERVMFTANQTVGGERKPIYHTNVMMCLGSKFSVICINSIDDLRDRKVLVKTLKESGKKVIEITEAQKEHFAGNMLNVADNSGKEYCVMSRAAFKSLRPDQIEAIEKHATILYSSLDTIEALGGGSARCMMAEIFLPKKK
jgi:hypothetical protein